MCDFSSVGKGRISERTFFGCDNLARNKCFDGVIPNGHRTYGMADSIVKGS